MTKLEYVKDYWAAESAKDLDRILDHFHEEAEFVAPTMALQGRSQVAEFYRGMIGGFKEILVTPVNSVEAGDSIAGGNTWLAWCATAGRCGRREGSTCSSSRMAVFTSCTAISIRRISKLNCETQPQHHHGLHHHYRPAARVSGRRHPGRICLPHEVHEEQPLGKRLVLVQPHLLPHCATGHGFGHHT